MIKKTIGLVEGLGPARTFLILGLFFGLLFMIFTPPFQGPDEEVHYLRAYQISDLHFTEDRLKNGDGGGSLPISLGQTIDTSESPNIAFYAQLKYHESHLINAAHILLNPSKQKIYDFSSTAQYSPATYLGGATAMFFGRILKFRPILLLYLGRLGDLCLFVLCGYFAIKLLPRRKWALVALCLVPMAIFEAAMLNGDSTTMGSAILFFAYIMYMRENVKLITKKQLLLLLLLGIFMTLTKQIMFIFLPLILLLKNKQFDFSKRDTIILKTLLISIPFLFLIGWLALVHNISNATTGNYNHQNPTGQIHFLVHSPLSFINALWNTYFFTWGDYIVKSFIGDFGWADSPISDLVTTLGYIGLALLLLGSVLEEKVHKQWLTGKEKLLTLGVFVLYFLAINGAQYVFYSPVGFKIIEGMQGRYFVPAAPLLIPLLYRNSIRIKKETYMKIAVFWPVLLLVAGVYTLFVRYYIKNV